MKMRPWRLLPWRRLALATLLCVCTLPAPARSQSAPAPAAAPASVEGFNCSANSTYPCQAYALYRAGFAGVPLDLSAVGDLFGVSRFMIAHANNLSSTTAAPAAGQPLLVPLQCGCPSRSPNAYAPTQYQISSGDTYWIVSVSKLQNLTQYQAVERVNPTRDPTKLEVGDMVTFPIFCQCPAAAVSNNNATALVTYVMQQGDTYASVADAFAVDARSLVSLNGPEQGTKLFSEILVPLRRQVPQWLPPIVARNSVPAAPSPPPSATPGPSAATDNQNGVVTGLAVGLGVVGGLWLLQMLLLACLWRRLKAKAGRGREAVVSGESGEAGRFAKSASAGVGGERFLVSDISEWLDKYRVFKVDELERGTGGFDDAHLIQGSVYKANIDGEVYAVKKMKWDACEELKILQKVNHSNLVKLEGFCINSATGDCYLVYEYVENGSLDACLLDRAGRARRLDWRTRLHVALDLAHGLQYIHEHTWPRVVHKDIKSSNVLLDARMRAKIANFGLARSGHNAVTTHIVGTQGYIAPEYIADGLVTTKMDVFAYGVVLLELVSGREAAGDADGELLLMADAEERLFRGREEKLEARAAAWMDPALAEQSCPPGSVAAVVSVARACLQRDPSKRPSMVDVAYTLSRAEEYFADYSGESASVGGSGELAAR